MSLESDVINQFNYDIKITRARYEELIKAEHDANLLKDLIFQKAEKYDGLLASELVLLENLYFIKNKESEE